MAQVVITIKVMPESPDSDLDALTTKIQGKIVGFCEQEAKVEVEPVAFGLKALKFTFVYNEQKGTTDDLEAEIANFEEVSSAEVIDCRRAIG